MLSKAHQEGITKRGISLQTAITMGVYSGKFLPDGSVEADDSGRILCFPFFEEGEVRMEKYRWSEKGEKRFSQRKNPQKAFYNGDVLMDDESLLNLEVGRAPLVIVEGEFDTMAVIEAGHQEVVSVPDGAPPARDKDGNLIEVPDTARDIDPASDHKFGFIGRYQERLNRVKHFVIATDDDEPGRRLAKELVRRLGAARCRWIEYPKDPVVKTSGDEMRPCKDLNEVLEHFGKEKVIDIINSARDWPVKGLYKLSDYPEASEPQTYETGLCDELDDHLRLYPGAFMVVTGIPGMGKSTLVNQISVEMARRHGWNIAMFSGEMPTVPYITNALMTAYLNKNRHAWTPDERAKARVFIQRYYTFIDQDPRKDEDDLDIDQMIELAATSVFRNGTKLLIIDPWNELEHRRDHHFSLTEYVGDSIRKLKRFAQSYDCAVCVVAHPKKTDGLPGLYDISDSAHWANKADLSLIVHSDDPLGSNRRTVMVPKVRFSSAGKRGMFDMDFDPVTELYKPYNEFAAAA